VLGKLVKPSLQAIQDLSLREVAILAPLVVITIAMGFYPKPIFDVTSVSVANLIHEHKLAVAMAHAPSHAAIAGKGEVR
jgi:NADH-quinone oxidoreductase subunit M